MIAIRPTLLLFLGTLAATTALHADEALDEFERLRLSQGAIGAFVEQPIPPDADAVETVNTSNSFLKEREPEMTAEEYALYEKVVAMLESNPTFALKMLEAMMGEKKAPSPAFEFILGNAHYAAGNNDKAERNYRNAVTRYPTFLRAWTNLGVLYYTSGRYPDAAVCFSRAIVLGDREPKTFGLLGYSLEQGGEIVSAEMAYMQALAGDPFSSDWKEGLLRIYIQGRQFGRAEPLVRTLIAERPKETRYWMAYANILVSADRKLQAISLLEVLSQAALAGAQELALLGDLYAEQSLDAEAVAIYTKLQREDRPLGEQRLLRLAQALAATARRDEARQALAALQPTLSDAGRIQALLVSADLAAAEKRWEDARAALEQILAVAPMNGRAWLGVGQAHAAQDQPDRARLAFEAALADESTAYRARLHLANLEVKNRHYASAVEHLDAALKLEDSADVRDYLSRLKNLPAQEGVSKP